MGRIQFFVVVCVFELKADVWVFHVSDDGVPGVYDIFVYIVLPAGRESLFFIARRLLVNVFY